MKLQNSTDYPDSFLRKMSSWCMKQVGMPGRYMRKMTFRNRKRWAFSGHATPWTRDTVVSIGPESAYPCNVSSHGEGSVFKDRLEALVAVTAHEVFHVEAERKGSDHFQNTRGSGRGSGSSESVTCKEELRILELFRASRDQLVSDWTSGVKIEPKTSLRDKRMAKAQDDLARWTRRLKLATTKVRKLRAKIKRLENAPEPKPRKPRANKESPFAKAKRYGIGVNEHVNRGEHWVYPPDGFESEEKDPYYGDHITFDRREMRERVDHYAKLVDESRAALQ